MDFNEYYNGTRLPNKEASKNSPVGELRYTSPLYLMVISHCILHLYEIYTNILHFFHTKALKHIYLHLVVIPKSLQHFEIDIFSLCGNKNVSLSFNICLCVCVFLVKMFLCVCKYYLAWWLQRVWEHFEGSSPSDH